MLFRFTSIRQYITGMNRFILWIVLWTTSISIAYAQDFNQEYRQLLEQNDTATMRPLLQKWEQQRPDDPDMLLAYLNYYVLKSYKVVSVIDVQPYSEYAVPLKNKTGDTISYINGIYEYVYEELEPGLKYIDKAIQQTPDRLDYRLSKVNLLRITNQPVAIKDELILALQYSYAHQHQWKDGTNALIAEGKEALIQSIQEFVQIFYNTQEREIVELIVPINDTILKYDPYNPQALTNLSFAYVALGDMDKSFNYILQAYQLWPNSFIVNYNVAMHYKERGDVENAKKHFNKALEFATPDQKAVVEKELSGL